MSKYHALNNEARGSQWYSIQDPVQVVPVRHGSGLVSSSRRSHYVEVNRHPATEFSVKAKMGREKPPQQPTSPTCGSSDFGCGPAFRECIVPFQSRSSSKFAHIFECAKIWAQNPVYTLASGVEHHDDTTSVLTLAISLNTAFWASSKRVVTSCRVSIIATSCPTAFVIRVARLLRS